MSKRVRVATSSLDDRNDTRKLVEYYANKSVQVYFLIYDDNDLNTASKRKDWLAFVENISGEHQNGQIRAINIKIPQLKNY